MVPFDACCQLPQSVPSACVAAAGKLDLLGQPAAKLLAEQARGLRVALVRSLEPLAQLDRRLHGVMDLERLVLVRRPERGSVQPRRCVAPRLAERLVESRI